MFQLYSHSATQPLRGLTEFRQSGIGAQLEGNRHQIPSSTGIREDTIMMVARQWSGSLIVTWDMSTEQDSADCHSSPRAPGHILEAARAWTEARVEAGARPLCGEDTGQRPRLPMAGAGPRARAASHDLVWPCHGLPVLPVLPHCHSLPIRHELTPGSCSPTVQGRGQQLPWSAQ